VSRALRLAVPFWLAMALAVWNGFFDVLVTRGEKQYLLGQARHEAGTGPPVSMDAIMTETIHDAAFKASLWAAVIVVAGLGGAVLVLRAARCDPDPGGPRRRRRPGARSAAPGAGGAGQP
jgi:hypothetical protein